MFIVKIIFLLLLSVKVESLRVVVAGATGYIGRQVVSELVQRGIPTTSLVRSLDLPNLTKKCLQGSDVVVCDVLNQDSVKETFSKLNPTTTINCLASRSGVSRDAWAVDYQGGLNVLDALEKYGGSSTRKPHYVLLSAFCVGKPLLQFQFAKLELEAKIRKAKVSHSIVRPTAFFKSLDGQIESVQKGNPILYFGDGTCSANAISEKDLAIFLSECAINPREIGMYKETRNVGGPDVPPITKRQQAELIYDTLEIPENKRKYISIPLGLLDIIINTCGVLEKVVSVFGESAEEQRLRFEDAAEITRIIKYYASEPMVAISEGEVHGTMKLKDHFYNIAKRGGQLEEIDKMTTTTGILEVFASNDYVK